MSLFRLQFQIRFLLPLPLPLLFLASLLSTFKYSSLPHLLGPRRLVGEPSIPLLRTLSCLQQAAALLYLPLLALIYLDAVAHSKVAL
jgi:hypothetical protein